MELVLIDPNELKSMIRELLAEALQNTPQGDEIGGIELAEKITGLKPDTIYKKVQRREIPFRQDIKKGRVTFSRNELLKWLEETRKGTKSEYRALPLK